MSRRTLTSAEQSIIIKYDSVPIEICYDSRLPLDQWVEKDLGNPVREKQAPKMKLRFLIGKRPRIKGVTIERDVVASNSMLTVPLRARFRTCCITFTNNKVPVLTIHIPRNLVSVRPGFSNIRESVFRLLMGNYLSRLENLWLDVLYSVVFGMMAVVLIEESKALVHGASLMSPSGEGVLILGWSDTGKTSAAFGLMQEGWILGGDDYTIVNELGQFFPIPKRMPILTSDKQYGSYVFSGWGDCLNWWGMGIAESFMRCRIRRRLKPPTKTSKVPSGPVKNIILLKRGVGNEGKPKVVPSSPSELARVATAQLVREFDVSGFLRYMCVLAAEFGEMWSLGSIVRKLEHCYQLSFAQANCWTVTVPNATTGRELGLLLREF